MYMCVICSSIIRYPNLDNPNVSAQLPIISLCIRLAPGISGMGRNRCPRMYCFASDQCCHCILRCQKFKLYSIFPMQASSKNLRSSLMQELFPAPGIPSKQSRRGSSSHSRQWGSFRFSCSFRQRSPTLCKKAMCSAVGGSGRFLN